MENGKMAFSGISIEETWLAMEDLVKKGLTKAIGLSNFNTKQVHTLDICVISWADITTVWSVCVSNAENQIMFQLLQRI